LEVSAFTRRERLERIAAAERDRREGRAELALAALGGAEEWPARIVLALSRLDSAEGDEAREILEATLDEWAAELGLGLLCSAGLSEDVAGEGSVLDAPIERDELERAFAEAEAEVDQMRDVNEVAERVLLQEPPGVVELSDDDLLAPVLGGVEPGAFLPSSNEPDAAWADQAVWPEAVPEDSRRLEEELFARSPSQEREPDLPASRQKLKTLERWLGNLERKRTRGAQ